MKKRLVYFILVCAFLFCCGLAAACGGHQHMWDGGEITRAATKTLSGEKTYHCSECSETKTEEVLFVAPTQAQVYSARQAVIENEIEGYNFSLDLSCNLSLLGLGAEVSGSYDGQYRHNERSQASERGRTGCSEKGRRRILGRCHQYI